MKLRTAKFRPIAALLLMQLVLVSSCGAPTKSSEQVSGGLNATASDRLGTICANLQNSEQALITGLKRFQPTTCATGAVKKQRLTRTLALDEPLLDKVTRQVGTTADEKVLDISASATVQMGISFARFAAQLGKAMNESKYSNKPLFDPNKQPPNLGTLQDLMQMETTEPRKLEFDDTRKSFAGAIDVKNKPGTIPKINLNLEITGKILDDSVAVRFTSSGSKPYAQSLVEKIQGLILLVPYDNDVLAYLYVDASVHQILQGEKSMLDQVAKALGGGFGLVFSGLAQVQP